METGSVAKLQKAERRVSPLEELFCIFLYIQSQYLYLPKIPKTPLR
jgi:hypothetical protein